MASETVPTPDETTAAGAVRALTGPRPIDSMRLLPNDFGDRMGYVPDVVDGYPSDPAGDCSSPVPLPERFTALCRTHDYGYDILRVAEAGGRPLGAWARRDLDDMLVRRMLESCSEPACLVAARAAQVGLSLNSWRQQYRAPRATEPVWSIVMTSLTRTMSTLLTAGKS